MSFGWFRALNRRELQAMKRANQNSSAIESVFCCKKTMVCWQMSGRFFAQSDLRSPCGRKGGDEGLAIRAQS